MHTKRICWHLFSYILCGILLFSAACSIFGGANELQHAKGYSVVTPTSWQPTESSGESDHSYRLPTGSLAFISSSCNRIEKSTPEILTKQLLIGTRNIRVEKRESLVVNGKESLYSSVEATLDGVLFYLEIVVVPFDSCVFDFTLLKKKNISEHERVEFFSFVKSLHYGTN